MNITPALPRPYQPPSEQERGALAAVRAPSPTRDSVEDAEGKRQKPPVVTAADVEHYAARAEAVVHPHEPSLSAHANRALASYGQVAGDTEKSDLRNLLGFDAYA